MSLGISCCSPRLSNKAQTIIRTWRLCERPWRRCVYTTRSDLSPPPFCIIFFSFPIFTNKVQIAALNINETIRERELREELVALDKRFGDKLNLAGTPGRRVLKEGKMMRITARRGGKEYYFHLLSDLLLYSALKVGTNIYKLHRTLDLKVTSVASVMPKEDQEDKYGIQISSSGACSPHH